LLDANGEPAGTTGGSFGSANVTRAASQFKPSGPLEFEIYYAEGAPTGPYKWEYVVAGQSSGLTFAVANVQVDLINFFGFSGVPGIQHDYE